MSIMKIDSKDLRGHGTRKEPSPVSIDPIERREEYIRIVSKFSSLQRAFLSAYIHHGRIATACEQVGIETDTVNTWEENGVEWRYAYALATADSLMAAQHTLEQGAVKAVQTLMDLLDNPDPKIKLGAADKITKLLEKSKVKKIQHEHSGNVNVDVDYKSTLMRMLDGEEKAGANSDPVEAHFREVEEEN